MTFIKHKFKIDGCDCAEIIAKINKHIEEEFNGYRGNYLKQFKWLHYIMRYKPLTKFEKFLKWIGFDIQEQKIMSDKDFLKYLEDNKNKCPKPTYKINYSE